MIDLAPNHLETVRRILAEHMPDCEVRAFGSRAKWEGQDYSDLDLAVVCDDAADRRAIESLKQAFKDSDLPIRVDVLDWHAIAEDFRKAIESDCEVLQERPGPIGWREVTIGEIADVVGGGTPPTKEPDNFDGDIPWLTPRDLSGTHDRYIARGKRNLSRQGLERSSATLIPAGSVLLSTRAPIGYVALAGNPISTNQGFRNLVMRDQAISEYCYYWLKANTSVLERHASGTTFRELPGSTLKTIRLQLPPIEEQRTIAGVLGALDDRIELNLRISQTLEDMARALFQSWFVDFDPVHAKAEGRPSGLPPDLDALVPAAFEESELGEIPQGWSVKRLGDLVEAVRGRSYRSSELTESDTALVTLKSFARGGGYRPDGLKPYTGKYKLEQVVEPGELVIACTDVTQNAEVVGRPAIVAADSRFATLVASLDTLIVRPLDATVNSVPFYYYLTCTTIFTQYTYARCSGTTVLHLSRDEVPAFRFPAPPRDLIHAFAALAGPAHNRMLDSSTESAALSAQRDTLLPRLLSGKLRVGEATGED